MSSVGYTSKDVVKNGEAVAVGASATNTAVTGASAQDSFNIQLPFLCRFRADIVCSGVTAATGITAKLQVRFSNEQAWTDSKTATISGNGVTSIALLETVALDQPFLPLKPEGRIVISTGAGDAITVQHVYIQKTA